jgi:hypothetical protein
LISGIFFGRAREQRLGVFRRPPMVIATKAGIQSSTASRLPEALTIACPA